MTLHTAQLILAADGEADTNKKSRNQCQIYISKEFFQMRSIE
jgi:hypothetical protein